MRNAVENYANDVTITCTHHTKTAKQEKHSSFATRCFYGKYFSRLQALARRRMIN